MARLAPIPLAGMIAATATFALAATEANAQTTPTCPPETGSACRIDQTQTGEVTGEVNLDVAVGQLTVSNTATGDRVVGGIQSTSGAIVSTWDPVISWSSLTRAANGAGMTVSIFMDSSTTTGAPASTSSPTATGVATTSAGAGERRTPPSSRETRCITPSTSIRCTGP